MLAHLIPKIANFNWTASPYRPRPSQAGPDRCVRQQTYHAQAYPMRKPGDRLAVVLDDSTWHEELTIQWLDHSLLHIHDRQRAITIPHVLSWLTADAQTYVCSMCQGVIPTDALHGHIDGLLTDLEFCMRLFEHKAINHFTFERYVKEHWPLDHFSQIVIYLKGLQVEGFPVQEAILLIKNKNTSQYLEYGLSYHSTHDTLTVLWKEHSDGTTQRYRPKDAPTFRHLYQDAVTQFHQVEHYRHTRTLPDRPYLLGEDWQCEYCPYTPQCWPNGASLNHEAHLMTHEEEQQVIALATLTEKRKTIELKEKEQRRHLKLWLKNVDHSTAIGPTETTLALVTQHQRRVDQSRIPKDVLEQAKVTQSIEKLKISRVSAQKKLSRLPELPTVSHA